MSWKQLLAQQPLLPPTMTTCPYPVGPPPAKNVKNRHAYVQLTQSALTPSSRLTPPRRRCPTPCMGVTCMGLPAKNAFTPNQLRQTPGSPPMPRQVLRSPESRIWHSRRSRSSCNSSPLPSTDSTVRPSTTLVSAAASRLEKNGMQRCQACNSSAATLGHTTTTSSQPEEAMATAAPVPTSSST